VVFGAGGGGARHVESVFEYGAYGGRSCMIPTNIGFCHQPYPHFGYSGQYQDDESGLVYLRARYYDPGTQQFISRDPAVGRTGQPYAYAYGNPISYSDPAGLEGGPNGQVPPRWTVWEQGNGTWKQASQPGFWNLMRNAGEGANSAGSETSYSIGTRGTISYGERDKFRRASWAEAVITQNMPKGSEPDVDPKGWISGIQNRVRGHLLTNRFGGSGHSKRNLVILVGNPVNQPIMTNFEAAIARAVASGEIVWYRVTPIYKGANYMPYAVTLEAHGTGGFTLGVSIFNHESPR